MIKSCLREAFQVVPVKIKP